MRKPGFSLLIAGLAVAVTAGSGYAFTFVSAGGSSCQPQQTDAIYHTTGGASNPSTSATSTFMCPLNFGTQVNQQTLSAVVVRYVDNSSSSAFNCFVYEATYDGTVYLSTARYTCATAGGCTSSTTSYTGGGYLQWNNSDLGATLGVQFLDGNYGVTCSVPPTPSGTNYSRVVSYYDYY